MERGDIHQPPNNWRLCDTTPASWLCFLHHCHWDLHQLLPPTSPFGLSMSFHLSPNLLDDHPSNHQFQCTTTKSTPRAAPIPWIRSSCRSFFLLRLKWLQSSRTKIRAKMGFDDWSLGEKKNSHENFSSSNCLSGLFVFPFFFPVSKTLSNSHLVALKISHILNTPLDFPPLFDLTLILLLLFFLFFSRFLVTLFACSWNDFCPLATFFFLPPASVSKKAET